MDILNSIQRFVSDPHIDFDYAKSFSSSNMPIAVKGIKGEIVYMNEPAKILLNSSKDSIFVSYDEKLSEDIKYVNDLCNITVNKKININTGNGSTEERFFNIESITMLNKFGLFSGTLFIFRDLTSLVCHISSLNGKTLKNNTFYDEMTGMFTENQFDEIFSRETERSERYRFPLSLSVFYFENLIFFGNSFGNDKLNQVLKFIGMYFKQRMRKTDIIFRIDFNNFTSILPHTNYESAYKKFKKIKDEFAGLLKFPDNVKPVLKYGISELNLKRHYKNYNMLIEEAKLDLAKSKVLTSEQDTRYAF